MICQECSHAQRFHVNNWNNYSNTPRTEIPCVGDEGECGCAEFVPYPDEAPF